MSSFLIQKFHLVSHFFYVTRALANGLLTCTAQTVLTWNLGLGSGITAYVFILSTHMFVTHRVFLLSKKRHFLLSRSRQQNEKQDSLF